MIRPSLSTFTPPRRPPRRRRWALAIWMVIVIVGAAVRLPMQAAAYTDPFTGGTITVPPPPEASPPQRVDPEEPVEPPAPPDPPAPTPKPAPTPPAAGTSTGSATKPTPPPSTSPPPPPIDPALVRQRQLDAFAQSKTALLAQFKIPPLDAIPLPATLDAETAFGASSTPPAALQIGETEWREVSHWQHEIRALAQKPTLTHEEAARLELLLDLRNAYWLTAIATPGLTAQDRKTLRLNLAAPTCAGRKGCRLNRRWPSC